MTRRVLSKAWDHDRQKQRKIFGEVSCSLRNFCSRNVLFISFIMLAWLPSGAPNCIMLTRLQGHVGRCRNRVESVTKAGKIPSRKSNNLLPSTKILVLFLKPSAWFDQAFITSNHPPSWEESDLSCQKEKTPNWYFLCLCGIIPKHNEQYRNKQWVGMKSCWMYFCFVYDISKVFYATSQDFQNCFLQEFARFSSFSLFQGFRSSFGCSFSYCFVFAKFWRLTIFYFSGQVLGKRPLLTWWKTDKRARIKSFPTASQTQNNMRMNNQNCYH